MNCTIVRTNMVKEIGVQAPEKDFYARQAMRIARRHMVAEAEAKHQRIVEYVAMGLLGAAFMYLSMFYAAL